MKKSLILIFISFIASFKVFSQCDIPLAALDCENAPIICNLGDLDGYCTTLPDFPNPTGPSPICNGNGVPNNTIWIGFIAYSNFINATITPANCTSQGGQQGIQGGIYGGPCDNIIPIVCQGNCQTGPINLQSGTFEIGQVYWFAIDGCNGSSCDITIDIDAGAANPTPGLSFINGKQKVCTGSDFEYKVNPSPLADYFYWTLNGNLLELPELADENIIINFDSAGVYHLCIDVSNYCVPVDELPAQNCFDITVSESSQTYLTPVEICARDSFNYLGKNYPVGIHNIKYKNQLGCDSIITLTVDSIPIPITDLGTIYLCKGECISITDTFGNGGEYCKTEINKKIYLQSWLGCDSIINVSIKSIDLKPDLNPAFITCKDSTATLKSNINPAYVDSFKLKWTTNSGNVISADTAENILVNAPGTYCLNMIMYGENGIICYDTVCTFVGIDTVSLSASYYFSNDSILACNNKSITVIATSDTSYLFAKWKFMSEVSLGDSISIDKPGTLSLILFGANGCQSDTLSIEIKSTYIYKDSVNVDTILCNGETILIDSILYTAPGNVEQWIENIDTCTYIHYFLNIRNQADTTLSRCDNEILVFFNKTIPLDSTYYTIPVSNSTGCDTVWHIKINKYSSDKVNISVNVPKGTIYHGVLINKDTVIIENYENVFGCDSIVQVSVKIPVSTVNTIENIKFTIVPNPGRDYISIESQDILKAQSFEIFNSVGQMILSHSESMYLPYKINVSALTAGMYWIKLNFDNKISTGSFIKIE